MAEKYQKILSNTACYSAISFSFLLAKETGIFTTLLKSDKPLTSEEIAKENNIRERYAREILGCLSSIELARVTPNEDGVYMYDLEAAAKEALMGPGFSLPEMAFTKLHVRRYDAVKECLGADESGAVRYDESFFDMVSDHKSKVSQPIIDCLLGNVDGLQESLEKGIDVIEVGCGTPHVLAKLAPQFPNSRFTATDINPDFVAKLRKRYSLLSNLRFDVVDLYVASELFDKKYDWVFACDVIHDLPHVLPALKTIRGVVKEPEGVFTFMDAAGTGSHEKDVGDLFAASMYAFATFSCIPESFQSGDSEAHGVSWGKETALGFCKQAGFETTAAPLYGKRVIYVAKPV